MHSSAELSATLEKREERLKKKERRLEEELTARERLEQELESARKEYGLLQSVNRRQEQALAKRDKQLAEQAEELEQARRIQEQIFNLSKLKGASSSS